MCRFVVRYLCFFILLAYSWTESLAGIQAEKTSTTLSLADSIRQAVENSHLIKNQKSQSQLTAAKIDEVKSSLLPSVEVGAVAGSFHDALLPANQNLPLNSDSLRDHSQYVWRLSVIQNLFSSFQSTKKMTALEAKMDGQRAALIFEAVKLRHQIVVLYFESQKIAREIRAEEDLRSLRANQSLEVKRRIRQGRATEYEKTLLDLEDSSQEVRLRRLYEDLGHNHLKLKRALGLKLDEELLLSDPLETAYQVLGATDLMSMAKALSAVLESNPQLKMIREESKELKAEVEATLAKYGPSLDFKIDAESSASDLSKLSERSNLNYSAKIELKVPIFSGLGSFAVRRQLRFLADQKDEEWLELREEILVKLSKSYSDIAASSAAVISEKKSLELAKKATGESQRLYASGRLELSRVLESYQVQLSHELGIYQSMYEQVLALASIKELFGK